MTALSNFTVNILGTVSFDGKFKGMRKAQNFIVYPMQDSGTVIHIQSDNRFGVLDIASGKGVLSANRQQYANHAWLSYCLANKTASVFQLDPEDLTTLKNWIKSTGGVLVGNSMVKSENIGAISI